VVPRYVNITTTFSHEHIICHSNGKLLSHGLELPEAIRIRRWESMIARAIEELRLIKTYRTPNALQNFGRLFSMFLPPLFAPYFVQLIYETSSIGLGIGAAVLVSYTLTSLFECSKVLEDPFVLDYDRSILSFDAVGKVILLLDLSLDLFSLLSDHFNKSKQPITDQSVFLLFL
jgi:hypothetical protein